MEIDIVNEIKDSWYNIVIEGRTEHDIEVCGIVIIGGLIDKYNSFIL